MIQYPRLEPKFAKIKKDGKFYDSSQTADGLELLEHFRNLH